MGLHVRLMLIIWLLSAFASSESCLILFPLAAINITKRYGVLSTHHVLGLW